MAIEFLNPTGSMAAKAALYQPIDPTDEIEDVARQIMRCIPEDRIYGGLVLPPNVDSFPGPSGPASRCPPNRVKTEIDILTDPKRLRRLDLTSTIDDPLAGSCPLLTNVDVGMGTWTTGESRS